MRSFYLIICIGISALAFGSNVNARDMQTLEKRLPADPGVKQVTLDSDIGAAEITLTTHAGGDMFSGDIRYDADKFRVDVEYEKTGTTADILLSSEQIRKFQSNRTRYCRWEIGLSRDYIWEIDLEIGASEGEMDFSGLPLEEMSLDIGASDCRIVFASPNPQRMRQLAIDAGAGDIEIIGLGYANFDRMSYDGGAGRVVLNFDGLDKGKRKAKIDVGVGEVRLELPDGFPVRVTSDDNWLNSVDVENVDLEEVDDGVYETEGFGKAAQGLEIDLDVGIGQAVIGWNGGAEIRFSSAQASEEKLIFRPFSGYAVAIVPPLPALPRIPALPELSRLPSIPELPELPDLPAVEALPELPELPEIPPIPPPAGRRVQQ